MSDVQLRTVIDADLPIFFEHQREPEAVRMAAFPAREREAFLAHWAKILADKTVTARTVVVAGDVAGNIVSWSHDGKRLVGYWIGQAYWGRGVATRALAAFLEADKYRPLYAYVAKQNVASIRVLEKCGFTISPESTAALEAPADGVEEWVMQLEA